MIISLYSGFQAVPRQEPWYWHPSYCVKFNTVWGHEGEAFGVGFVVLLFLLIEHVFYVIALPGFVVVMQFCFWLGNI